ncbi:MAG: alpha/beta hydrolase-fold protein [Chitinophagaceae bacterium]
MIRNIRLLTLLLLLAFVTKAQDRSLFEKRLYIYKNDTLPYRILLPVNYDPSVKYPLVLFLHGAGERGRDNEKQLTHGAALFLRDSIRNNHPAIVVFPQCMEESYWSNVNIVKDSSGKRQFYFRKDGAPTKAMMLAQRLLKDLQQHYPVNSKQVYVGGLSMGGMGTFEIARRNPKTFAAAFAICGGADPATAGKLRKIKWQVFHGGKDDVVNPDFSRKMVAALKQAGADVQFTLYPDANHNSWDSTFAEPALLYWLFSQRK